MLRMAKPCAFTREVRGHVPPRKFFKIVQIGAFCCIFGTNFVFKIFYKFTIFYIKILKNNIFYIKNRYFSLLWGNSHKEIFAHILRLMRFGVYFEKILNKKWLFSCRNNYINYSCTHMLGGYLEYLLAPMRKF